MQKYRIRLSLPFNSTFMAPVTRSHPGFHAVVVTCSKCWEVWRGGWECCFREPWKAAGSDACASGISLRRRVGGVKMKGAEGRVLSLSQGMKT